MEFKVHAGHFGEGKGYIGGSFIRLRKKAEVFGFEEIPHEHVVRVEKASEENVRKIGSALGLGIAGAALLGPAGLIAGTILGKKSERKIAFICHLRDGRIFLATGDDSVYLKFQSLALENAAQDKAADIAEKDKEVAAQPDATKSVSEAGVASKPTSKPKRTVFGTLINLVLWGVGLFVVLLALVSIKSAPMGGVLLGLGGILILPVFRRLVLTRAISATVLIFLGLVVTGATSVSETSQKTGLEEYLERVRSREEQLKKEEERHILSQLKQLPIKDYTSNLVRYYRLIQLYPNNERYRAKYEFYKAKVMQHKDKPEGVPIRVHPGDKGKYYLLETQTFGLTLRTIHKRVGLHGVVGWTMMDIDCFTGKFRERAYTESTPEELIDNEREGRWVPVVFGSSKYWIYKFVCDNYKESLKAQLRKQRGAAK